MCRCGLYSLKHFRMNICTVVRGNKYRAFKYTCVFVQAPHHLVSTTSYYSKDAQKCYV